MAEMCRNDQQHASEMDVLSGTDTGFFSYLNLISPEINALTKADPDKKWYWKIYTLLLKLSISYLNFFLNLSLLRSGSALPKNE